MLHILQIIFCVMAGGSTLLGVAQWLFGRNDSLAAVLAACAVFWALLGWLV